MGDVQVYFGVFTCAAPYKRRVCVISRCGEFFAFLSLFKVLKTNPDTGHNGWNGSTSILFILLGSDNYFGFSFVAVSIFGSIVLFGLKPAAEDREKVTLHRKQNIVAEVMSVLRMIVNHRMILLVPLFSCLGFQSIFVNSMYNRQVVDTAECVSLYDCIYCG